MQCEARAERQLALRPDFRVYLVREPVFRRMRLTFSSSPRIQNYEATNRGHVVMKTERHRHLSRGLRSCTTPRDPDLSPGLTVIVPAFNEAGSIADTIESLRSQTRRPQEILVVDDCSTDDTAAVAAAAGAKVLTPPANTGSKAGAQTFALPHVKTDLAMAVDADTTLAGDAIELLLEPFSDPQVAAASGAVIPRHVTTMWERGRYVEYLFAFSFFKRIQDHYGKPMISSGCFSAYRTKILRQVGGWSTRTMAEDMDLTWTLFQAGWKVRFLPEAVCYPIEPHDLDLMRKQLRRWSHGFVQNVLLHRRGLLKLGYLRSMIATAFWDAAIASLAYILVIPLLALLVTPTFLLGYVIDAPVVLIPVVLGAHRRHELGKALMSFPSYFVLRMLNGIMMLNALIRECVLRKPLLVYEKGH